MGLTLGRTFTTALSLLGSFVSIRDTASGEVVRGEFDLHLVAGKNADVVHPHLPRDVSQHVVAVLEFDTEHCIRKRLDDRAFEHDGIVFWFGQGDSPRYELGIGPSPADFDWMVCTQTDDQCYRAT